LSESQKRILPPELADIIASFLSHDNASRALANLSQTCRAYRNATLRMVYETLVIDGAEYGALLYEGNHMDWFQHVK
jgi:hypothetical protein